MTRKSLCDILRADQARLQDAWDHTKAADDYGTPLPAAEYTCHLISADLFNAKTKGTPGVKLAFKIIEGEHRGRYLWHDIYLTPIALPMAKRDLAKLGVTALEQLERTLPSGIRCKVKVTLRNDNDGSKYNRVKQFEVVGIDPPDVNPFAPVDSPSSPAPAPQAGEGSNTQTAEGSAGGDDEAF